MDHWSTLSLQKGTVITADLFERYIHTGHMSNLKEGFGEVQSSVVSPAVISIMSGRQIGLSLHIGVATQSMSSAMIGHMIMVDHDQSQRGVSVPRLGQRKAALTDSMPSTQAGEGDGDEDGEKDE